MWEWALNANNEENRSQMSSILCHEVICMCSTGHAVIGWPSCLDVNFKTFLRGIPLEWSQGKLNLKAPKIAARKANRIKPAYTPAYVLCAYL